MKTIVEIHGIPFTIESAKGMTRQNFNNAYGNKKVNPKSEHFHPNAMSKEGLDSAWIQLRTEADKYDKENKTEATESSED